MNLSKEQVCTVLIAEDDEDDFFLIKRNFGLHYPKARLQRVFHGEELLEYLKISEKPTMVILDLNMPKTDGREVLEIIKKDEDLKDIPVVVLTTSSSDVDRQFVLEQGAVFLTKPYQVSSYFTLMNLFKKYMK